MSSKWPSANGPKLGSALEYVKQIKQLTKLGSVFPSGSWESVNVDNIIFRLHSIVTVFILMTGTMFSSMKSYFGENIECLSNKNDLSKELIQLYCWMEGSFSVYTGNGYDAPSNSMTGYHNAYPGVKPYNPNADKKIYHRYYQWVYFILIIQSIMFYVPRYLWKAKEAKRLRELISELKKNHISEMSEHNSSKLIQDVADSLLIGGDYFFFFVFCEVYYFFHLVAQIWFTNIFLQGQFLNLGVNWLRYNYQDDDYSGDPLIKVFPRLTKCSFHRFGFSGSIETHDSLCFLPLNIVNEKIYVVLWFWYIFLFLITAPYLVYRVLIISFSVLRFYKLRHLAPNCDKKHLKALTKQPGIWFVLEFLADNMKTSHFRDLINRIMEEKFFDKSGKPTYISLLSKNEDSDKHGSKHNNGTLSKYSLKEKDKKGSIIKSKKKSFGDSMLPSAPFLSSSSKSYKDDKSDKFNLGRDDWSSNRDNDWKSGGESNNNEDWP